MNKKLNIHVLKLQDISRFQLGTFMHNFVHSELPPPLMTLFTQNTDINGHKIRQSHNSHVEHRQNKNIPKTSIINLLFVYKVYLTEHLYR